WPAGTPVHRQVDRRRAIMDTLEEAASRDVVLVAGKGHEAYQELEGTRHPFSDVDVVQSGLQARSAQGFMTLGDVAACMGSTAALQGDPRTVIRRVHTDTRTLQAGDLFVALRGERFDG
ncbi:MAG: hypothetical protein ACKOER_04250, partial [Betaproteobacteria bacterium]